MHVNGGMQMGFDSWIGLAGLLFGVAGFAFAVYGFLKTKQVSECRMRQRTHLSSRSGFLLKFISSEVWWSVFSG